MSGALTMQIEEILHISIFVIA